MLVYDKDGKEYDKDAVDAYECVSSLGWTLSKNKKDPKTDGEVKMNEIDAVKAQLDKMNVNYSGISGLGNLSKLLARAKAIGKDA